MNHDQKIDYAYHVDRLGLLIAQRAKLPADSDLVPALNGRGGVYLRLTPEQYRKLRQS